MQKRLHMFLDLFHEWDYGAPVNAVVKHDCVNLDALVADAGLAAAAMHVQKCKAKPCANTLHLLVGTLQGPWVPPAPQDGQGTRSSGRWLRIDVWEHKADGVQRGG